MMPSIGELIGGRISVKAIRDVRFEDLLGREEVRLDAINRDTPLLINRDSARLLTSDLLPPSPPE